MARPSRPLLFCSGKLFLDTKLRDIVQYSYDTCSRRLVLPLTLEERIALGKAIYESGLTHLAAGQIYGISEETARRYKILYEQSVGIPHLTHETKPSVASKEAFSQEDFQSMSKEELISELMKSKINEARLKKGYMVKGDGANKEYFLLDNKNTK